MGMKENGKISNKTQRPIAKVADLLVMALVVLMNPLSPLPALLSPKHPRLPDKVLTVVPQHFTADTITHALSNIDAELAEIEYYLRIHNVTDEGYNLIAQYNTSLLQERRQWIRRQQALGKTITTDTITRRIAAKDRPMIAVKTSGGFWRAGRFITGQRLTGKGLVRDAEGRVVSALWDADTIVTAIRRDTLGLYQGQMDRNLQASGQGTYDAQKGCHYEGFWRNDQRCGFGFESSPLHQVRIGEWKDDKFKGERMRYTTERIYGIDISRHQHEKGRRRYGIQWSRLRITSLGKRHDTEGHAYPVSFIYIKATEGTTIRNRYFQQDYQQARRHGIRVGAYHFFSLKSTAQAQAQYFLKNVRIASADFPPVLDVEPTDAQIRQIGGEEELMKRIRMWMQIVEQRTGRRPVLYVSQMFVNRYMNNAADIKQHYNVWIARYGQYKPDVKLAFWQLCADGRVDGITGPVDINVFNGYQGQWDEFLRTGFHQ